MEAKPRCALGLLFPKLFPAPGLPESNRVWGHGVRSWGHPSSRCLGAASTPRVKAERGKKKNSPLFSSKREGNLDGARSEEGIRTLEPAIGIFATRYRVSIMPDALGDLNTGLHILKALSRPFTFTIYMY